MHVDGFRFDLAIALAREPHGYDKGAGFFDLLHQNPVLSRVKLIAEPWDLGDYGYQLGNFPVLWSEWNGRYRDTVRRFWRGDRGQVAELAYRLSGSTDLYRLSGHPPTASVNFVTAHDGFTLRDLVSYNEKHNEANCEDNHDGTTENLSSNCGAEGPTERPEVNALRARQQRNLLATLLLSQGVRLLLGGDELGRTQHGNNNAYCQDNALSWIDWTLDAGRRELLDFVSRILQIRREHPVLRRRQFFDGWVIPGSGLKDVTWLHHDGRELEGSDWADGDLRCLGMRLAGDAVTVGDEGTPDRTLLILLNAGSDPVAFVLPAPGAGAAAWEVLAQTAAESARSGDTPGLVAGARYGLAAHALALLGAGTA
jgi:isoamylase